jgi:hypothetical protein
VLKEVTLREIEAIFAVTDPLGISREALVIPLLPRHPGRLRKTPAGKIEIVVESEGDFADFLKELPGELAKLG